MESPRCKFTVQRNPCLPERTLLSHTGQQQAAQGNGLSGNTVLDFRAQRLGCYSPCSRRSERHIFIHASESITNLPRFTDEKIWSHYSNPRTMPLQLSQPIAMQCFLLPPLLPRALEHRSNSSPYFQPSSSIQPSTQEPNNILK